MMKKLCFKLNRKLEVFIKRPLLDLIGYTCFYSLLQLEYSSLKLYEILKNKRNKKFNKYKF